MSKREFIENKLYKERFSQAWAPQTDSQKFDCDQATSKVLRKRNTLKAQNTLKTQTSMRSDMTTGKRNSNLSMSQQGCQFLKRIEICKENLQKRPSVAIVLPDIITSGVESNSKEVKIFQNKLKQRVQIGELKLSELLDDKLCQSETGKRSKSLASSCIHPRPSVFTIESERRGTLNKSEDLRLFEQRQSLFVSMEDNDVDPKLPTIHQTLRRMKTDLKDDSHFIQQIRRSHQDRLKNIRDPNASRLRYLKRYPRCLILPDDPWKKRWDLLLLLACVITSVVTPYHVAFFDQSSTEWLILEGTIDFIFFVDIILSFMTAYHNHLEELIDNRRAIACNYLKYWFFIDLISILPIHLILESSFNVNSLGQLARIPRIYKITKTLKQVDEQDRVMRMMRFVKKGTLLKNTFNRSCRMSVALEKSLKLALGFLLLLHTMSCFWYLIAKLDDFPPNCWIFRYGLEGADSDELYIDSLYFTITTITTVGYGDRSPDTKTEKIFVCILMIIGVIAYTMLISQLTSIISANDRKEAALKQKLDILSNIRKQYGMNFDLYLRLRQSIHHHHLKDKKDNQELLEDLPNKLGIELSNLLYKRELKQIKIFQNMPPHFVAQVAPKLKHMSIAKGEYIYMKDDPIDGSKPLCYNLVYFLKQGQTAYVLRKNQLDVVFAINKPGSFFGETDFANSTLDYEATRQYSVKALSDVELLVLEKKDLYKIDIELRKEISSLFEKNKDNIERLKRYSRQAKKWMKDAGETVSQSSSGCTIKTEEFEIKEREIQEEDQESESSTEINSQKSVLDRSKRESLYRRSLNKSSKSNHRKSTNSRKQETAPLFRRETLGDFFFKQSASFGASGSFSDYISNNEEMDSSSECEQVQSKKWKRRKVRKTESFPDKRASKFQSPTKLGSKQSRIHSQMRDIKEQFCKIEHMMKNLIQTEEEMLHRERRKYSSDDFERKSSDEGDQIQIKVTSPNEKDYQERNDESIDKLNQTGQSNFYPIVQEDERSFWSRSSNYPEI